MDRYIASNKILSALHSKKEKSGELNEITATHVMRKIHSVWDNGGKTADRYTILFKDSSALILSDNPGHPQGVSMWDDGVKPGSHLGKKISFKDLPKKVQDHAITNIQFAYESVEIKDPKLAKQIKEWGQIKDKMTELSAEVTKLKKEVTKHEKSLLPIIEDMVKDFKKIEERVVRTDDYIVTITRKSSTKETKKWKEAFELALTKVNDQTKKVLDEAVNETAKVSKVATAYTMQPTKKEDMELQENVLAKLKNTFSGFRKKVSKWLSEILKLDPFIKQLEKIAKEL